MQGKAILLSQFDSDVNYLKIDLSTGNAYLISNERIDRTRVSFGMFECEEAASGLNYVALLATRHGPLMLLNEMQLYPKIDETRIEIKDEKCSSHLVVMHQAKKIFEMHYKNKFGIGLHPYNKNREDIDFYYWLSKNVGSPKIYEIYTKKMDVGDTA